MKKSFVFLCLISVLPTVMADETNWSAFGTLGITMSDSNTYGYRSDISKDKSVFSGDIDLRQLSLIGGQVDHRFTESLDFVGQIVIKDKAEHKWGDYFTLGFVRYTPSPQWTIRLGRLAPDLFMLSDYRDINIAYTWANVPNEVYGLIPFTYFDGGDITYSHRINNATINLKVYGGTSEIIVTSNVGSELVELQSMYGTAITFDKNDWNIQWRYTQATIGNNDSIPNFLFEQISQIPDVLWPNKQSIFNSLTLDGETAKYMSFSGQKYLDNWLLSFELTHIDSDSDLIATLTNGYMSAAYQRNDHTWYGVLAQTESTQYTFNEPGVNTQLFPEIITGIESSFNFYSSNQKTFSLGWRWDLSPSLSSKLQINHTVIDAGGATLWFNRTVNSPAKTVTSVMYTLSFAL